MKNRDTCRIVNKKFIFDCFMLTPIVINELIVAMARTGRRIKLQEGYIDPKLIIDCDFDDDFDYDQEGK